MSEGPVLTSRADASLAPPEQNSSSSEPNSSLAAETATNTRHVEASSTTNIVKNDEKPAAVVVRPKPQRKVELTEEQKLQALYEQTSVYRFFGNSNSCFWLYRRRGVFSNVLNLIFLVLDIADMVVDVIVAAGAPSEQPAWKATLWLACAQGFVCLLGVIYIYFANLCSKKRKWELGSTVLSLESSIVWKTMVKIIPVSTEDFLATYAIIGLNDLQGNTRLDLVSALSVILAGCKCISIGCAAGCLVFRSKLRMGCYWLMTFGLVVLESLTGFGMGGFLIYLAFTGNIDGSYRFVFLAATVVGWISAFAMIYTSMMLMMVFTLKELTTKKQVPFKNPLFWIFLLVPGLCVPLIEKYSPEDFFSKKRAKQGQSPEES